jgi:hypothetical protein
MFNPLVDSFSELTDTEVENKILELTKKYYQTHNPNLQMQIANILDMYRSEAQVRRANALKSQQNNDNGLDSLINVS